MLCEEFYSIRRSLASSIIVRSDRLGARTWTTAHPHAKILTSPSTRIKLWGEHRPAPSTLCKDSEGAQHQFDVLDCGLMVRVRLLSALHLYTHAPATSTASTAIELRKKSRTPSLISFEKFCIIRPTSTCSTRHAHNALTKPSCGSTCILELHRVRRITANSVGMVDTAIRSFEQFQILRAISTCCS